MDLAAVLLITSVFLVLALILLTVSLMRNRGTARELEAALADESGARDRAALLLAIASAVNSSLALEEVLNVALTHAGRIMGAVAGAMYLVRTGKTEMYREASYNLNTRARGGMRKINEEPLSSALSAMRPLVVKLDEQTAPGLDTGGHPQHVLVVPIQRSGQLMGAMELYLNAWRELSEDQAGLLNGVASQAAIAIRHAQLFQAQEENALTDELTKLPNRRHLAQRFLQEMQRARRHHNAIAFLMI
ncbi:MAG: GAF domain-containing protein, partial [Chloroflexi bacterium]